MPASSSPAPPDSATPGSEVAEPATSDSTDGKLGFAVVGLGASAGGLDAFKRFFSAMPVDSGMAFVLIQHLDPNHISLTDELLSKHTSMPVAQVIDEVRIEPNHVYVIPPNKYLTISGQTLHLSEPVERRGLRAPIDFFFRSLADDRQEKAIGILLTGTGTDGTQGVREIKAAGGMVMVQTPETAQYDGMVRSAIASDMVDFIVPIEKMPEVLQKYVQHWYVNGNGGPPASATPVDHMNAIVAQLRARIKYDFSCYKKGTLTRRVQRRMGVNHIENLGDYVEYLRKNKDEATALYKDLLISVTNFFREPEAWALLEKEVIAPLVAKHNGEGPIRVWVAGCATGEEAYSFAMLLLEQFHAVDKRPTMQIFASDIDQNALAFARAGVYPESIAEDVSPERLQRFFSKGEHTYQIHKEIREAVVFAEQNVISDPPFSRLDLISCRNLLIYLEAEIQKKIFALFHFALAERGCLFLGNSETISQPHDLFEPVSRKWRIYRRIGPAWHDKRNFPVQHSESPKFAPQMLRDSGDQQGRRLTQTLSDSGDQQGRRLTLLAQQLMLHRFAPACVLVNRKSEVLYLHGPVDEYLRLHSGEPGNNLLEMAREGLRTKLRAGLQQAIRDHQTVVLNTVRVKRGSKHGLARVMIEPLRQPKEAEGLLLVRFEEEIGQPPSTPFAEIDMSDRDDSKLNAPADSVIIQDLENELRVTHENLQSTIEELETSNEEFKAANEEVTSVNEELQSTNEELETSKEELQSLNEEMQTLNSQLEQKISELEALNNDLGNLLASTDLPIIFLNRQLRIKRFTPSTRRLLRVIAADVGRPIADIAQNVSDPDLLSDATLVLERLAPIEKEVQDHEGHSFVRRIAPYRTEEHRIDGVVITFNDITRLRNSERRQREAAGWERAISQSAMDALIVMDHLGRIVDFNPAAEVMFGRSRTDALNQPLVEMIVPPNLRKAHQQGLERFRATGEGPVLGKRVELSALRADGSEFPVELSIVRIPDFDPPLFTGFIRDITQRKRDEFRLREFTESLEKRVKERTAELESVNAALRVSELRFRTLLDSAPDAMVVVDDRGEITQINRRTEELFGYDRFELIGQSVEGLVPERLREQHQDDRAKYTQAPKSRPMGAGKPLTGRRKDGTEFPVEIQLSPLQLNDRTLVMAAIRDVSDRNRMEEARSQFAAIMENTSAAIITLGLDGTIWNWNRGAMQLLGYSAQEAIGKNIVALVHQNTDDKFSDIADRLRREQTPAEYESVFRHKQGHLIPVALTTSLVMDGHGQPAGICKIARDISERIRLEQKIAEVADEERQRWGRELHDSLGQEMSSVGMLATLLRQQLPAQSPESELAGKLEKNIDHAKQEMRRFAKGLFPVAVDAEGLTVALRELAQDISQNFKVNCHFEGSSKLPLDDNFAATQLFMIIREAAHNAAKHAHASEIVIRMEDGQELQVSVRDNGQGLPPGTAETATMGLRIMKHRSHLIGATLRIESPKDGGTLVSCRVPVTRET